MSRQIALGDVRPSSADVRYIQRRPFHGTIQQAIAQARAAKYYSPPRVTARQELLNFLRLDGRPLSGLKEPKYGKGVP